MRDPLLSIPPFDALDLHQFAVLEHGLQTDPDPRPLLVLGSAGTGKTHVLAHRAAYALRQGGDAARLLLLTASRRTAQSLQRLVGQVLRQSLGLSSAQPLTLPWCGTFQSVGVRLLRTYGPRLGLEAGATLYTSTEAQVLMAWVSEQLGFGRLRGRFPTLETCWAIYTRVVASQQSLADVLQAMYPGCLPWHSALRQLFGAYAKAKQRHNVMDAHDVLLYWAEVMANDAGAAELGSRFDQVLVDDYQLANRLQSEILLRLKPSGEGVAAAADDTAAAVGQEAGAAPQHVMTFARLFARPARVVRLQQNHRATQPLRAACQAVLAAAPEVAEAPQSIRLGRRPRLVAVAGEVQQAQWVAAEVQRQGSAGVPLRRQAVLMRTPEQSTVLELELARRGIAFFSACSTRWLESAHIQDFLALLRWLHNPRDRLAGLRVLHMLPGVDTLQADQLLHAMAQAAEPWTPFAQFEPAPAAHAFWASLVALRAQQTEPGRGSWPQRLVQLQDWYELQLPRLYDDAALRQPDIERGVRLGQGSLSCEHFLTELALEPPELAGSHSPPTDGADGLRLLTLDRLQGQEWQSVYILQAPFVPARDVWACEAAAPLAHERRLLHSAMSRARENLFLLVPHAELPDTDAPSKEAAGQPRLFTPGVLDAFEQVTATQLPDERRPTACKPAPPFRWPVGARARAVWR